MEKERMKDNYQRNSRNVRQKADETILDSCHSISDIRKVILLNTPENAYTLRAELEDASTNANTDMKNIYCKGYLYRLLLLQVYFFWLLYIVLGTV